jgi:hypothetical protein
MIANSADEQYMYTIQAMIDLDFNDALDPSRLTRTYGMIPGDIWETS